MFNSCASARPTVAPTPLPRRRPAPSSPLSNAVDDFDRPPAHPGSVPLIPDSDPSRPPPPPVLGTVAFPATVAAAAATPAVFTPAKLEFQESAERATRTMIGPVNKTTNPAATFSLPLPTAPGMVVRIDYFGPLPVTPHGNPYILLFANRFNRRTNMFEVSAAKFSAEGTADVFVNRYVTLWGCPITLLSDNGMQSCSKLFQAMYRLLS